MTKKSFRLLACAAFALLVLLNVAGTTGWSRWASDDAAGPRPPVVSLTQLPAEARETAALIARGGPFAYPRDGVAFGNRERILPQRERGYYREYTVPTPGLGHRGARRIVAGRDGELYYTDDHYRTFKRIRE